MKKTKIEIANPNELSVSVNPGCFNLAENGERKSTFEICNNNGFPLYFKLMASNAHAMKFQPECGRLGRYGSVTVTGHHVQSARPIGLQQKVAIMTSRLPLEEWPDQEHYKPDGFFSSSSPSKKHRCPSKSFVPSLSPSPHFDRYEHEILRTTRHHGELTSKHRTVRTPERRLITTIERPIHTPERKTVPTTEMRHTVHSPDRRTVPTTTERRQMILSPDRRTVSITAERRQNVHSSDRRTVPTTKERRQIIHSPDRRTVPTTAERRQYVHSPDRRTVPTTKERLQNVHSPDRRTVPTTDRRTMAKTNEERTMVATTERRTVPATERRTTMPVTTERRNTIPAVERRMTVPTTERRRTVPIIERETVLATERRAEGLSSEDHERHVKRREGGCKDRGDIRTKRIDIFCHCRNCKGSYVKMKEERRGEGKMRCEVVKKSCQRHQGVSSDENDSIYQNTVNLELEQQPTSSSESYGSYSSGENSCLIEKFNTMINACNKILTLTQYNFLLILLLLLVLIISSRNMVISYLWPQPFCYKYPWFSHYFGAK